MKRAFTGAILAVLISGAAFCQSNAAAPEFEVAHIQASKPGTELNVDFLPGGRFDVKGATMKDLITMAWGLEDGMVSGGEKWLDSDRFDIVAKAPASVFGTNSKGGRTLSGEAFSSMMQTLLVQRFKLAVHKEEKVVPVYALTVGKQTPKLKETAGGDEQCKMQVIEGVRTYKCQNMTMAGLADRLGTVAKAYLDHPVVDLTGLTGAYDFTLAWTGRGKLLGTAPGSDQPAGGMTVFEAVSKQLGLDLAARKHALPGIVVDHVERAPAEN
jgi:uncharacterized protein (TIGR03435 family)